MISQADQILEDDVDFFPWAAQRWPAERFTVQLDPWELSHSLYNSADG